MALNASNHTWEDGIWVAMENETDNWTGGAIFTYTIDTLLNMTYRYYFKAVDAVLGDVELAAVEFTIKAALPTEGVVSGMVTNENGENVTDAKVIIYYIEENSTFDNVTNKTVYNNITHNFDTTTLNGSYEKTLAFGTYTIYVTHADYEDAAELTFTLDVDTLAVTKDFELKAKAPTEYDVIVGPFKDGDGNAISGAVVKFTLNLTRALTNYTATTNATGYATFTLPVDAIPADTEMTITKGDYTETWKYGAALPILIPATPKTKDVTYGPWTDFVGWELTFMIGNDSYKGTVNDTGYVTIDIPKDDTVAAGTEFVLKKGDEEVKFKEGEEPKKPAGDGEEDSLLWLWIVIIVVVLLVIIIIVVMSKKKKPEPTIDLEEEEMEEGIGEDYDEDMDTLAEEEDFSDFEGEASDDEFDGVDDLESELEEFDEDEDLGFEDEELGDYEDEFGDEEFDDDIGDDFDDDFDDDLDEDFDDDF